MQYQGESNPCTQMPRVSGDGLHRFGSCFEQDGVDHRLVAIGQVTDRRWQGKHQMVILDRQQVGLALFEPAMSRATLALRAMPVTAGVVSDLLVLAGRTTQYMTTEYLTTTSLDGRHHLELAEANVTRMRLTPYWSLGTEDIRDLQRLSGHDSSRYRQNLQWAGHFLQYIGGDLGIEAGGLQFAVTE